MLLNSISRGLDINPIIFRIRELSSNPCKYVFTATCIVYVNLKHNASPAAALTNFATRVIIEQCALVKPCVSVYLCAFCYEEVKTRISAENFTKTIVIQANLLVFW